MNSQPKKNERTLILRIKPQKSAFFLWLFSLILALASFIGQSLKYWTSFDNAFGLVPLFNIGSRLSVQTIYSVLLLLSLMLLLRIISIEKCKTNGKFCPQWKALPFFALYLALHRGTGVHSLIIDPLVDHLAVLFSQLHVTRFYVTLVLCALIFLFFYTRLFLSLPKRTKLLLIITAVLFLLGVRKLGFALNSLEEVNYLIVETISKWLEMSGTILLLYAFLDYLETDYSKV